VANGYESFFLGGQSVYENVELDNGDGCIIL
jgi:hypothetical protein